MTPVKTLLMAALLLSVGCNLFDTEDNRDPPGVPSVSQGLHDAMKITWGAASDITDSSSGTKIHPTSYTLKRNGSIIGSTPSTSWVDTAADPASKYSYSLSTTYSDGSTSDDSDSATGWYVPANDLVFGEHAGTVSEPGSAVTSDGWFETLVVKGWIYHFTAGSSVQLLVCDHGAPWNQTSMGTGTSVTWTADRTGTLWIRSIAAENLEAWYQ